MKSLTKNIPQRLLYIFLSFGSLSIVLPLLWMVSSSLKTTREIFGAPFKLPADPQWTNFIKVWSKGLGMYFRNSLFVTSLSVAVIVLLGGMAAYALARMRFKGRMGIYLLLVAGYAIPMHTVLVPLYRTLNTLGWIDTHIGLIGPYVAFGMPFAVILLYAFFLGFPRELEEASLLDGCNTWQMLWHVVLPLSLPGISSVAIVQGVFIWNEFLLALIVIREKALKTLPLGLAAFQGQYMTNWPLLLTAVTLASIPMFLLYLILQRQFINSLTGFSK